MKLTITLAVLMLAACNNQTQPPEQSSYHYVANMEDYGLLKKFCDEGRAIYVVDSYRGKAMSVIPDAKECQNHDN